ncbi:MAG: hypothetical protein A2X12_05480 [Bacteroidetes bacterium GWE2_29_8]|nr:MAG: hypothetical protein A2X12_05480 [Bacteroidetes bacterium GWE2_29_8]
MHKILLKNRNIQTFVCFLCIFFFISSCKETGIEEPDLKDENIIINCPLNNLSTNMTNITFWWESIEYAEGYQIIIVYPNFTEIQKLIVDTNIVGNKFNITLSPGQYEWKIRAYNSASKTSFHTYQLNIIKSDDLTMQSIILLSPDDYDTTNNTNFTFNWEKLVSAYDYRFTIRNTSPDATQILSVVLDTNSIDYVLGEGAFEWEVRGQNNTTNTIYSTRHLYVDLTSPNKPIQLIPANNSSVNDSIILFSWDRGQVSGSSIYDSVFIYKDASKQTILRSLKTITATYKDSLGVGNYWWDVVSYDKAGNVSSPSDLNNFTVK